MRNRAPSVSKFHGTTLPSSHSTSHNAKADRSDMEHRVSQNFTAQHHPRRVRDPEQTSLQTRRTILQHKYVHAHAHKTTHMKNHGGHACTCGRVWAGPNVCHEPACRGCASTCARKFLCLLIHSSVRTHEFWGSGGAHCLEVMVCLPPSFLQHLPQFNCDAKRNTNQIKAMQ